MFGWINDCTEKLVLTKFGIEQWHAIKAKAGCEVADGGFIRHEYYPDESTVQLVVAASEILGLTVDQVLEAFGTYFMEFVRAEGYENLLQCQGNTLSSWLSNMNALHDHLESSLPRGMVKPVFWCETPDCSTNHHDNNKDDSNNDDGAYMILHYYSKRGNLLVPLVIGVVKEVARYHFDVVIEMILLQKQAVDGATHTRYEPTIGYHYVFLIS
jgi:Haem-NO-binding